MSALSKAVEKLLKAAKPSNKIKSAEKEKLQDVKTRLNLLDLSSPSPQIIDMICSVLREPLIPMYIAFPEITLELCLQTFLSISKKIAVIKDHTDSRALQWQGAQRSLLSGVLDFLEERRTEKNQSSIAKALYFTLCSTFFPKAASNQQTTQTATNLLSTVCLLLSESAASHPGNQSDLRDDKNLGGLRLGHMLFRMRGEYTQDYLSSLPYIILDYLALESLLNLFATLLPPPKSAAKRSQFIKSVFGTASPTHISCGKELTDIVQKSPLSEWEITSARIIETLAKNDIAFLLALSHFKLYLDTRSFFANVDKGDAYETFQALYNHVSTLNVVPSKDATVQHVTVHLTSPPIVGVSVMKPSDPAGPLLLRFDIHTSDLERFVKAVQARNLRRKDKIVSVKSSLCESTSLDFDSMGKPYREPSAKEKIETIGRIFDETRDSLFASDFPDGPPNDALSALQPEFLKGVNPPSPITAVDPRRIWEPVTTPKKKTMTGPVPVNSPLYESVFGTSDDELSEISEPEVLPKGTRTRPPKGDNTKHLVQTNKTARRGKARKIVESDAESISAVLDRPNALGNSGPKTNSKALDSQRKSFRVPPTEDTPTVEAPRPKEFSEKSGAALGPVDGPGDVEPKKTRGRPRRVVAEAPPTKQDSDQTTHEAKQDPKQDARKRPIVDRDEDRLPPSPANKRRRLENTNADVMIRKPSARTAAMLESPKKAAALARRYRRKDRISSPAIVGSSDPVVDFDDVPHSAVNATINSGRRRASLMKKKDGKNVQRKPVTARKLMEPAAYVTRDEDDQDSLKVGGKAKQEGNRKLGNKKNEKPNGTDTASDNIEVPFPLPPTPPAPKANKARKAPWQEPSFLNKVPENLPETGPPERDFTSEVPMPSETAFDNGLMPMQDHEYSIPVQSTSEDATASDDKPYIPPTIDLTVDSPIRPAPTIRNVTKSRSKGARDVDDINATDTWPKETEPKANSALKDPRRQPSETPPIDMVPQNQAKTVTFEVASKQSITIEDAVPKPTAVSSVIPRSHQQHAQTHSFFPEEATSVHKSAQFIPRDMSPAFLFQHDNHPQMKKSSHSPALARNGTVTSSRPPPLVTEQKAGFNHKSRKDKPYTRDETPTNQDAMEDIVATLKEIHEVIVQRVYERFDGVTKEVREGRDIILHEAAVALEKMRIERVIHFNNIVGLEEEYSEYRRKLTDGLSEVKRGCEAMDQQLGQILRDHDKFSLSKKFPTSLFVRSGGPPKLIPL
ncbi:hypothetical protein EYR38_004300 [Pleurotus pulmonarius]|nr:hypothetical protein EYR38_004300 [Pleurotus pulmonarius]